MVWSQPGLPRGYGALGCLGADAACGQQPCLDGKTKACSILAGFCSDPFQVVGLRCDFSVFLPQNTKAFVLAVGGLDAARAEELQVRDAQRPEGINEPFVMPPLFGPTAEKMLPVL